MATKNNTKEKKDTKKDEKKKITTNDVLGSFLKERKEDHYNFEDDVNYEVSSGSLLMDAAAGKIVPGILRNTGISRGGKSSHMLESVRQFLSTVENSRCVWIMAEGRLGEKTKKRSGLKFTKEWEEWEDGSVFILQSQVYETVFDLIRKFLKVNPENKRYFFVIDSVDGLKRKDDLEKASSESGQVAGGALLTSVFLSKVSLGMAKFGHICGMIGQVRSKIKIDPYAKVAPSLSSASGGAAADHYPTIFLEFEGRYKGDHIPKDSPDPVGHWCKVKIIKSDNEKVTSVRYPIKYNASGGGSVWREYEIADLMISWAYATKGGSWITLSDDFFKRISKAFPDLFDEKATNFKIQGMDQLRGWLEQNQDVTDYLFEEFSGLIV